MPPMYFSAWMRPLYDPVSHTTLFYVNDQGNSIYSNSMWSWNATTATLTKIWTSGTTGANGSSCDPTGPRDRHPIGQQVIDTRRSRMWIFGGPNQTCGSPQDLWYLSLTATPTSDTWHQLSNPAHYPTGNSELGCMYDGDDDLIFCYGDSSSSVYCPTDLNPIPGTLTALQTAAGCANADDFTNITTTGTEPTNDFFPGAAYDTVNHKAVFLGAYTGGPTPGSALELATYNIPTKVWTIQTPTGTPSLPTPRDDNIIGVPWTYNSNDGRFYYFKPSSTTNGLYSWKYGDAAWLTVCTACTPSSGSPSLPYGFNTVGMANDPNKGALILFTNASADATFDAGDIIQGDFIGKTTFGGNFTAGGKLN